MDKHIELLVMFRPIGYSAATGEVRWREGEVQVQVQVHVQV